MSGVLFLAHRVPFPPDRGDKIRSHHVLKALARLGPVHVGCFGDTLADREHEDELARVAASYCMPVRTKTMPAAGVEALAARRSLSQAAFDHPQLRRWVETTLAEQDIDTIYVFSGQMGQYVPRDWVGRLVVDLVDVDSAKFDSYASEANLGMGWIYRREARLLARAEAALAARAERTLLVSEAEAALLRERAPGVGVVEAMGNGIDAAMFDPQSVPPHTELTAVRGPHLVFTGQMDYPPNVGAALRTIERLLPEIRRVHPEARFHVVGRSPTAALRAHDGNDGVRVWGEVPDVRPFLAGANLVVVPLTIARGIQNKVLEAMAMARPVLLTPQAAEGIDGRDGEHFAVADSDGGLIERAYELLADRRLGRELGQAARRYVIERQGWPAMLARLPEIVGRAGAGVSCDAA
jgi:sugar transferase (PEP-CTERM/EpsH1 system associated)